jgi:hypothetical protein
MIDCSLPRCRRFSFAHPWAHQWQRQRAGILMEGRWYCSQECLRDALEPLLREHARPEDPPRRAPVRLPLRLVLFERGIVTSEQLEAARQDRAANHPDEEFGDTLLRLGCATETEVASARAVESGCPVYSGPAKFIPPALRLPDRLMRAFAAVPLCHVPVKGSPGRLFLGFGYRVHHGLVRAVETITGCQVEACLPTRTVYEEQLGCLLRTPASEDPGLAAPPISTMREEILRQAVLSGAESVRLGRAGPLLWVSLAGGPRDAHLLFDLAEVMDLTEVTPETRETDTSSPRSGSRFQTKVTARQTASSIQGTERVIS